MSARVPAVLAIMAAFLLALPSPHAQEVAKSVALPAGLHVEKLLAGPARNDIKCEVEFSPPKLTFQQRYLVRLRAVLDPSDAERRNRLDVFFVVKIADANGEWFPGETHNEFVVEPGFDKGNAIAYSTGFYVKPGKYTAALMVYDTVSGKTDVIRKPIEVKPPKNDPLPQLDRSLPTLEFVNDVPTEQAPVRAETRSYRPPQLGESGYHPEDLWPPGHGIEYLPVGNRRPLHIDIVLNLAPPVDTYMMRSATQSQSRSASGIMLQTGAILSHLRVDPGCVRVSAIDLSRLDVVFEPVDARSIDWSKLAKEVEERNNNTISVRALSHRTDTAEFLQKYIGKIADNTSRCGAETGPMGHAIVFVSRDFSFPSGTHDAKFDPDPQEPVRYFQIRISRYGNGDSLGRFFKGVKAQKFEADSPEEFRRALAQLISALGGSGKD